MICDHCGHSMPDGSLTCDYCGTYLGKYSNAASRDTTGVRAIRQGRVSAGSPTLPPPLPNRQQAYGDYDLSAVPLGKEGASPRRKMAQPYGRVGSSRPDTRRGVPVNANGRAPHVPRKPARPSGKKSRGMNWMLLGVLIALLVAMLAGGGYVYARKSEKGQRAAARYNTQTATEGMFTLLQSTDVQLREEREALLRTWQRAEPQAYWSAGQAYLDEGDVERAILCLRIGDAVDPENYDGLLLLANAYELNMQDEEAEALYLRLVKEVSPFRAEAYTALIRMYQTQGRRPEAADMMKLAYEGTSREAFRLEREDYIPEPPQISLEAGRYEINKLEGNVHLSSPQGYDIYYTTDDNAKLPEEGMLSENGSFKPREGSVTVRAVCVSGDLTSEEIRVAYTFYYPSPPAPHCNLAPNTYNSRREVKLRAGSFVEETCTRREKAEDEKHYRYYYTIDGSTPTEESPQYDGTPIKLPAGKVTLKAICVNQYGKLSSILEVGYKFNISPPLKEMYQEGDCFTGFVLNKTNVMDFIDTFGEPTQDLPTEYLQTGLEARHLTYPWGYAVFVLNNGAWRLVRVELNRALGNVPRGVGFGATEEEVVGAYKDFGQVPSANGDRGLYYDYPSVGKVYAQADGTRMVQYTCATVTTDMWVLEYYLTNDKVTKIVHYYEP